MTFYYQYSLALKDYILEIINKHRELTITPKGKIKDSDPIHCVCGGCCLSLVGQGHILPHNSLSWPH